VFVHNPADAQTTQGTGSGGKKRPVEGGRENKMGRQQTLDKGGYAEKKMP